MGKDDEYIIDTPYLRIGYKVIAWAIIALFIIWAISRYFGYMEIGRWFERSSYKAQYWVYLQPQNAKEKNYRVKADIEKLEDSNYVLDRVYWDNGGVTEFDGCNITRATEENGSANCADYSESTATYYDVRLGEKVK